MKTAKASELDRIVDEGEESILDYADLSTLRKPNQEQQRSLSIQLPEWLIETLDREANRVGVSRQAILKIWLVERADRMRATK